jgi:hypothetical protein
MLGGLARLRFKFILTMAAYDLIRGNQNYSERRHDRRDVVHNEVEIGQIMRNHRPRPTAPADQAKSMQIQ